MTLLDRYRTVRANTLALAAPLSPEDCQVQSMDDASPVKWHLAHTTWFWETFILAAHAGHTPDAEKAFLYNSYYNALGPRHARPQRGLVTRPTLDDIIAWRARIDATMEDFLAGQGSAAPGLPGLIELGLAHEEQHQELILMDVKHLLASHPFPTGRYTPVPVEKAPPAAAGPDRHTFEGGLVEIGHNGNGFAFDNEGPRHRVWLEPFALATRPVTNGDFAVFIADGGYDRPELWLSDGWAWRQREGITAPAYWVRTGADWQVFTLHGLEALRPGDPVCHISLFEAAAFAEWAGARLPTEAEWEHAAISTGATPDNGQFLRPGLSAHPRAPSSPSAPAGLFGGVWEWTRSDYAPYPGFRPAPGAVGEYNGKFMSGQVVLRGGCCATPPGHVRASYRNFFPPTARWAFSGLRLAWGAH